MPAHFRALLTSAALLAGSLTGVAAATIAFAPAAAAVTVPPAPSGWNTVFSDDFSGAASSAPSAQNWFYDIGTGYGTGETEQTTNSTDNVYLDGNGHLVLKATDTNGTWSSARIESTRDDFQAPAGGKLEMTASIEQPNPANGLGYWPAFWALGSPMRTGGGWPQSGEIDMMEDVNGLNQASQTLHDSAGSSGHALINCPDTSSGCQTGYHTYSVIVDRTNTSAETMQFLMDGTVESTITEASVGTAAWQSAIDHGFFIIFDLAMGGNYPDGVYGSTTPTSATTSGASMSVGYVAVYEQGGNSTPTGTATATGELTGINSLCATNQNVLNTEGNPIVVGKCDADPGQEWSPYSDGTVRVQGGCLDVVSAGTTSGTNVDWYPCNASNAQNWTYQSNGELVNPNSGLCLTDPGGNTSSRLDIETCTDSAQQQWKEPTGSSTGGGGGTGTMTVTASQYAATNSTGTEATADTGGGNDVGWINSASWLEYTGVNFGSGYTGVEVRDASAVAGTNIGTVQFRLDSVTATPFATVNVNGTGGWQSWVTSSAAGTSPTPTGTHTLYVTFTTSTGGNFVNVNWFEFTGGSSSSGTSSPVTVTASQYAATNSTQNEATADTGGGNDVGWINSASWLEYTGVNFGTGLTGNVKARIASAITGTNIGTVQFRLDSLTAAPFATVNVSGTGGWQTWTTATATASPVPSGTHTLYVTFTTSTGGNFVNVNWFQFS
ncbi:MAG TPA: carbohydrate-binding protein [Actinospica sp.]|jgi:hypothetical protein|nr:carbohydrate-binding protein [Actinospica sp.]